MLAMQNAPYIIGSYAVTLCGIAVYTWRILAQARKAARQVRPEDRPWS
ncbi:MAG: heme exporter protein CcmD [Actinomycetota bacterium]|nr:heme exporter protein CcmD [Actinomycetota bacterium]